MIILVIHIIHMEYFYNYSNVISYTMEQIQKGKTLNSYFFKKKKKFMG